MSTRADYYFTPLAELVFKLKENEDKFVFPLQYLTKVISVNDYCYATTRSSVPVAAFSRGVTTERTTLTVYAPQVGEKWRLFEVDFGEVDFDDFKAAVDEILSSVNRFLARQVKDVD